MAQATTVPQPYDAQDQRSRTLTHALHCTERGDPHLTAPIYRGWAMPGTATAAAGWRIAKFTYSGSDITRIEWASGNLLYDKVWDSRATYSYS